MLQDECKKNSFFEKKCVISADITNKGGGGTFRIFYLMFGMTCFFDMTCFFKSIIFCSLYEIWEDVFDKLFFCASVYYLLMHLKIKMEI